MRVLTAHPRAGLGRGLALAGLALALALGILWGIGAFAPLAAWATEQQRAVQGALAAAVRALRSGAPGAWAGLLSVCFAYGFFHAVGPGHGKAVIGSYGVARRVALAPLIGLALASSLAQAAVAVALVAGGAFALGWTRAQMEGTAEQVLLPLSHAMIAGLGLWLLWRGARGLVRRAGPPGHDTRGQPAPAPHAHHHEHTHHHHDESCGCGHAHGPTPEQAAQVTGLRDAALLVAAIGLRPCSGALFLLILCFAAGIGWAGVAGSFAMGLGTASVTVLVAALSVWTREGALAALPTAGMARVLPGVELVAGAVIAAASLMLLAGSL